MRISDWSSDVCSSDLTKRVNVCARAQSGCLRSFVAAIAKIPDLMPLPPGFCFITGFGPATRTLEKIAGALGQPIKVVALVHNHHGPATIDGMVGAEPELAARLQLGCNHVDRSRIHHEPLGMTRLGPGVGKE